MKKLSYKKPLVEVMELDAADILSTDGSADGTKNGGLTAFGLTVDETTGAVVIQ